MEWRGGGVPKHHSPHHLPTHHSTYMLLKTVVSKKLLRVVLLPYMVGHTYKKSININSIKKVPLPSAKNTVCNTSFFASLLTLRNKKMPVAKKANDINNKPMYKTILFTVLFVFKHYISVVRRCHRSITGYSTTILIYFIH